MKGCGTLSCMGQYFQKLRDCILAHSRATRFASPASCDHFLSFPPMSVYDSRLLASLSLLCLSSTYDTKKTTSMSCMRSTYAYAASALYKEGRSFHFSPQYSHLSIFSNPPSTNFFTGGRWPIITMNLLQFLQSVNHSLWNVLETWEARRLEHGRRLTSRQ
jgi:hypothetical protein